MIRRLISIVAAAVGAAWWWRRREGPATREAAPDGSAPTPSASARPRRRKPLVPPTPAARESEPPPPDSAEEGRTPHYVVPGEFLLSLSAAAEVDTAALDALAVGLEAERVDGEPPVSYPDPSGDGSFTVLRLRWPDAGDYDSTVERFAALEARVNEGIATGGATVTTWMPNWLGSIAAERLYTPGGPAAYPRPVPPPDGGLRLTNPPFLAEWRETMDAPVTLAVLDVFPTASALEGRGLPPALEPLAERLAAHDPPLTLDASRHYATFRTGVPFDLSDHGLVATWLATEIIGGTAMERVTLEPIRIATDEGVCSAWDVIRGLAPLARRVREGENIVALLAFVIGMMDIVPPRLRLYEEHYEALRLLCLSISEGGGTLLGAAGNDASGLQHPPRTRIPASFRSVIEVTSGQLDQSALSLYANQAKALCLFGGDTNRLYATVDHIPYLVGPAVATSHRVSPDEEQPNEHGWVAWAGTSFAAALAAGLAVLLRGHRPDARMWDVRMALRKLATDTRQPGNVPFIDLVKGGTRDA